MKKKPDIDLKGQGNEKIISQSNINDVFTRLEILLRSKLSGHTIFWRESSNLIDEFYKRAEIQNEQQ